MTNAFIRRSTAADLGAIESLYGFRTSRRELQWVLSDPQNGSSFRSYVGLSEDGRVVGHVGYVVSEYRFNDQQLSGVYPISWIVSPDCKGSIGLQLLGKVLEFADFSLVIGGSEDTQKIIPFLGFQLKFRVREYQKILNPWTYFRTLSNSLPKRVAKALYGLAGNVKGRLPKSRKPNVRLEAYRKRENGLPNHTDSAFFNCEPTSHVDWLVRCPCVETHAFTIEVEEESKGVVVCYINRRTKRARLVHLSFLEDDCSLWLAVLSEVERFFLQNGCYSISTLASHPTCTQALERSGYLHFKDVGRPVFIRDKERRLSHIPESFYHLTFIEGDLGYRGF